MNTEIVKIRRCKFPVDYNLQGSIHSMLCNSFPNIYPFYRDINLFVESFLLEIYYVSTMKKAD